jgi:hypothetical protein
MVERANILIDNLFSMVRKVIKISGIEYILYIVAPFGKIGKKKKILDYSY